VSASASVHGENQSENAKIDMNDQLVLRASKLKNLLSALVSCVFIAGGVWLILGGDGIGWFVAGFFGLCLIVFLVQMLPQSSYLRLDPEGFEIRTLFQSSRYKWDDVAVFGTKKIGSKMVIFLFSPEYENGKTARGISLAVAGVEGALPDTYGMSAEELANLMNEWREKHGKWRVAIADVDE
jgi:hypothetical protein